MKFRDTVNCCNFFFDNNVLEIATPNIRISQSLIQTIEIFYTIKIQFPQLTNRMVYII